MHQLCGQDEVTRQLLHRSGVNQGCSHNSQLENCSVVFYSVFAKRGCIHYLFFFFYQDNIILQLFSGSGNSYSQGDKIYTTALRPHIAVLNTHFVSLLQSVAGW